jgi:hypothetical protein
MFDNPRVGLAWYKPDQWDMLLEASVDRDDLEDTYFEWVQVATEGEARMKEMGMHVRRVEVDVPELIAWCREEGIPLDNKARSSFATMKLEQQSR